MKQFFTSIFAVHGLIALCIAGMLALFSPILCMADIDQNTARKLRSSGQILSLESIHNKARSIKRGKILETELEQKKGRYIYEVELLDEAGTVWEIKLDAATNTLIELEQD